MRQHAVNYKRIRKDVARRMFENDELFLIVACNVRENHFEKGWYHGVIIKEKEYKDLRYDNDKMTFDNMVNNFEDCNCQDRETGLYAAFYIKKKSKGE